jgi:hypothetical protein
VRGPLLIADRETRIAGGNAVQVCVTNLPAVAVDPVVRTHTVVRSVLTGLTNTFVDCTVDEVVAVCISLALGAVRYQDPRTGARPVAPIGIRADVVVVTRCARGQRNLRDLAGIGIAEALSARVGVLQRREIAGSRITAIVCGVVVRRMGAGVTAFIAVIGRALIDVETRKGARQATARLTRRAVGSRASLRPVAELPIVAESVAATPSLE